MDSKHSAKPYRFSSPGQALFLANLTHQRSNTIPSMNSPAFQNHSPKIDRPVRTSTGFLPNKRVLCMRSRRARSVPIVQGLVGDGKFNLVARSQKRTRGRSQRDTNRKWFLSLRNLGMVGYFTNWCVDLLAHFDVNGAQPTSSGRRLRQELLSEHLHSLGAVISGVPAIGET